MTNNKLKDTIISKEVKIYLLKLIKKGMITADEKGELSKLLDFPMMQIEVIDKTEDVRK